jgi:hypothetical protein
LSNARWAELHARFWTIIDELREENDRLKLSLMLYADKRFEN